MFSQRGVINLAHNLADVREGIRRVEANRLNGIDAGVAHAGTSEGILPDHRNLR